MKFFGRSTALFLLGSALGLSVTGLNRIAEAAEADKLNVCYSSIAATSITTWVPKEAGIYKKYGLDVSIIYVAGAQAITTLISGVYTTLIRPALLIDNHQRGPYPLQWPG